MMIFGNRLFGKVDAIPGVGHVATKCFHVNFIPLIPSQGWLVMSQKGKSWRGMKVPISFKSYFIAWCRFVAIVAAIVGGVGLLVNSLDPKHDVVLIIVFAFVLVAAIALLLFLKKAKFINHASYARACELAHIAGFNEQGMLAIAETYGEPPMSYGFQPTMTQPIVEEVVSG